ncbi:MAG: AtpZ/AtpI family protein [Candidatus Aminicenantes bacterium]|jgi:ATP synthase protein I
MGKKDEDKKNLAVYSSVGLMFPVSIAVGAGMGYLLDKWLNTDPYLLIIFALYGVAAGFWNLYKVTKRMSDSNGKNH